MAKKKPQQKKSRRRINWSQFIFGVIAVTMILTVILGMVAN